MPASSRSSSALTGPGPALVSLLMRLASNHRTIVARHGLSLSQYLGLKFVSANEPVRISELARSSLVSRPTATSFVDGMEGKGWVRRGRSEEDRRAVVLHLTPKAARTLRQIDAEQMQFLTRVFARLAPAQRTRGMTWLNELSRAAEAELATRGRTRAGGRT